MAFGVYFHIPYCLQRCTYCDFATYEQSQILPPHEYIDFVKKELRIKNHLFSPQSLDTIYFGGGTPSLIPAELIVSLIEELANLGFQPGPNSEITIEINPATIDEKKLEQYLKAGINRFSVGAQTFDNDLLKSVHREHNAQQTIDTLLLLKSYDLNYSFDILFALPGQKITGLENDVNIALELGPNHISPYCLTVPPKHPLSKGRPPEDEQIAMFNLIKEKLELNNYHQYEISNFAKSGYESRHNILYWRDDSYWGVGLSAHSYKNAPQWGARFWNHNQINDYIDQIKKFDGYNFSFDHFNTNQIEMLILNQSLTDFCHTQLRMMKGLSEEHLLKKFKSAPRAIVLCLERLKNLQNNGLVIKSFDHWQLTNNGILLSNKVFEELTFLKSELY